MKPIDTVNFPLLKSTLKSGEFLRDAQQGNAQVMSHIGLLCAGSRDWATAPENIPDILDVIFTFLSPDNLERAKATWALIKAPSRSGDTNGTWAGSLAIDILADLQIRCAVKTYMIPFLQPRLMARLADLVHWMRYGVDVGDQLREFMDATPPYISSSGIVNRLIYDYQQGILDYPRSQAKQAFNNSDVAGLALALWFKKGKDRTTYVQSIQAGDGNPSCLVVGLMSQLMSEEIMGPEALFKVAFCDQDHPDKPSDAKAQAFANVFVARVRQLQSFSDSGNYTIGRCYTHLGLFIPMIRPISANRSPQTQMALRALAKAGIVKVCVQATRAFSERSLTNIPPPPPDTDPETWWQGVPAVVRLTVWQWDLWNSLIVARVGMQHLVIDQIHDFLRHGLVQVMVNGMTQINLVDTASRDMKDSMWNLMMVAMKRVLLHCVYPSLAKEAARQLPKLQTRRVEAASTLLVSRGGPNEESLEKAFIARIEGWCRTRESIQEKGMGIMMVCDDEEHPVPDDTNATPTYTKHYVCTGCFSMMYCSSKCQRNHWKRHRVDCTTISKQRPGLYEMYSPKNRIWHVKLLSWLYTTSGTCSSHLRMGASEIAVFDMTHLDTTLALTGSPSISFIHAIEYPQYRRARMSRVQALELRLDDMLADARRLRDTHVPSGDESISYPQIRFAEFVLPFGDVFVSVMAKFRIRQSIDYMDLDEKLEVDLLGSVVRVGAS